MLIPRKYERDVDLLLAEEFQVSPPFAKWFLQSIPRFARVEAKVLEVAVSKSDHLGESDLIVFLQKADSGAHIAIFIEDKISAPRQPDQPKRYRLRADAGLRNNLYTEYVLVLCAPQTYLDTHPTDRVLFDASISYEEMAGYLAGSDPDDQRSKYRAEFLSTAAKKVRS